MARRIDRLFTPPADLPPVRWAPWAVLAAATGAIMFAVLVVALANPDLPFVLMSASAGRSGLVVPPGASVGGTAARGVAVLVVVVALGVTFTYAFWRFRLERLAWRPGPITVLAFTDDRRTARGPALAARLTASFEKHLAETKVYGPTAVPAAGRPSDFLRVVEDAGDRVQGVWGAISRFVRILAPTSAFRVACAIQGGEGEADEACTLVVELTRLTRTSVAPFVIREFTWDDAVERAARAVAARLLPRTEQCRHAPWTAWQGLRLPVELFDAYQRFLALRADRRFDDALEVLGEAIRRDPTNAALRLERGKLQERLQMYLDALLTYDDIITNAAHRDRRLAAWWLPGRGSDGGWSDPGAAHGLTRDDPVLLVARYRHALMLGLSGRIAAQWWARRERCTTGSHRTAREERRAHLREALRGRLRDRYGLYWEGPLAPADPTCLGDLEPELTDAERLRRTAGARVLFTLLGQLEFEHLVTDHVRLRPAEWLHARWLSATTDLADSFVRWMVVARGGSPRPGPVRGAVGLRLTRVLPREAILLGLPWACMRRAMALSWATRQGAELIVADVGYAVPRRIDGRRREAFPRASELLAGGWAVSPETLRGVVHAVTGRPDGALRSWRAHFNGACVLALPLVADDAFARPESTPDVQAAVASAAIAELERAVACADSGFLAQQQDWLLIEDPDLAQLRGRPEFKDFEARTYGSISAAVERGPDIHKWEQSAYVAQFIRRAAREMAKLWQARERGDGGGPVDPAQWLADEMVGWFLAERLALDSRDPRTRIDVARRIARAGRLRVASVPHPRFSDGAVDQQLAIMEGQGRTGALPVPHTQRPRDVADRITQAIRQSDDRLAALAATLRDGGDGCCSLARRSVLHEEEKELSALVEQWSRAPDPSDLVEWCHVGARRWSTLSAWFDDEAFRGRSLDERRTDFARELTRRVR